MVVLILAEKPSVAADVANLLGANTKHENHWQGNDLIVTWAIGHLLELKYMGEYDTDFKDWRKTAERLPFVPEEFQWKAKSGSVKKQLTAITKLIKDKSVTEIVNACDAAREGELIFRTIVAHSKSKAPTSRMWLQSMTQEAIQNAWDNRKPGEEYNSLRDAAYSRSEADWIIGMNGSRIATTALHLGKGKSISLGRVQTPTLAMIVDHELEVLAHQSVPYWQLEATFTAGDATWNARWERNGHKDDDDRPEYKSHRIIEASEKEKLETILSSATDADVTQKNRDSVEKPPLNFDLITLQREANNIWSWSAKRTLGIAQELYSTHKLTTYPRTDSRHLPEDMLEDITKTIRNLAAQDKYNSHALKIVDAKNTSGSGMNNTKRNFNNAKVSDHFAVIPTGKIPEGLSGDHAKLYDLIVRTFLASWYPEATWDVQKRTASIQSENFIKEARCLKSPGWREVKPKKQNLPEGWNSLPTNPCKADITESEFKEEKSKPKNRLKEAGLLRLMEHAGKQIDDDDLAAAIKDKGLGTPATRADTIEKLIEKEYIIRSRNGSISAAAYGIRIIDAIRRIPVDWITSAELTGEMESSLLNVQRGDEPRGKYMQSIVTKTTSMVNLIRDLDQAQLYANEPSLGDCPKCGNEIKETTLSYKCSENQGRDKGCPFVFWKDTSGRWFDRITAKRLIENKSITDLHGFFSRSGEGYDATITLEEDGKVTLAGGGESTGKVTDEELCQCPVCEQGTIRIGANVYACDDNDCKFRGVSKEMCKRAITAEEAKIILTDGKSQLLEDFTSKRNRPFSAFLVVTGNKISFEFPPRGAPADAKKFPIVAGVVAVCPIHSVNIVETETTYQPEEASSGCSIQLMREISKRVITREEAKELIEKKSVGPFDDFLSKKTQKPFASSLYLKKNESVGYKFAKR